MTEQILLKRKFHRGGMICAVCDHPIIGAPFHFFDYFSHEEFPGVQCERCYNLLETTKEDPGVLSEAVRYLEEGA